MMIMMMNMRKGCTGEGRRRVMKKGGGYGVIQGRGKGECDM